MISEMKIKRILDSYDDKMAELKTEYEKRFKLVSVNSFGEASASEILENNMWYVQEENRIKNEFIHDLQNVFSAA